MRSFPFNEPVSKIIETRNGPKFVEGQVIETPEGEKFIPGKNFFRLLSFFLSQFLRNDAFQGKWWTLLMAPSLYWAWRLTPSTVGVSSFQVMLFWINISTFLSNNHYSRSSYPDRQWHEGRVSDTLFIMQSCQSNGVCLKIFQQIMRMTWQKNIFLQK